jgi:ribonuclease HI
MIYTDGSALNNPGPGGWGVIVSFNGLSIDQQISGGSKVSTNNIMEMTAVLEALKYIESIESNKNKYIINTDSQYVQKGICSWITNWKNNDWKTSSKQPVKNKSLWILIDEKYERLKTIVKVEWVKAHNGNILNEAADQLANSTAQRFKTH